MPAGEKVGAVLRADVEDRSGGHRGPVADIGQARPLPGEDRGSDRGQGHAEARTGRVGDSGPRLGEARGRDDDGETPRRRGGGRGDGGGGAVRTRGRARARRGRRSCRPRWRAAGLAGPAAVVRVKATVVPPAVSVPWCRRPPCIATPCWRRCDPSRSRWPSSSYAGGLQAVRQAIDTQNTANKAGGKPPVAADALLAHGRRAAAGRATGRLEGPRLGGADAGKDYRLRELRAVVAASRTVILDEEGRAMAKALQESLDQRTTALREEWLARITNALNDGRVHRPSRPPSALPSPARVARPSWRSGWPPQPGKP